MGPSHPHHHLLSLPFSLLLALTLPYQTTALNCDAPLPGTQNTTYTSNSTPCLLRCNDPVAIATGTLLPGMLNSTAVPYCYLDCVHSDATPAQSALAPGCSSTCEESGHAGNVEVLGWCVYWCVDGYGDEVASEMCVPRYAYEPVTTVVDGRTETVTLLTNPAEYTSSGEVESSSGAESRDELTTESSGTTSEATSTADSWTATSTSTDDHASTSTSEGVSAAADSADATATDNAGTKVYGEPLELVAALFMMLFL